MAGRRAGQSAFPLGGKWARPRPRSDEGKLAGKSRLRIACGKLCPHQPPAGGSFPRGGSQRRLLIHRPCRLKQPLHLIGQCTVRGVDQIRILGQQGLGFVLRDAQRAGVLH